MKIPDTEPAFPVVAHDQTQYFGLTKHEYFAAMAMQGLLSSETHASTHEDIVAGYAVAHADALIAELNK